jgi:hypothetical protein
MTLIVLIKNSHGSEFPIDVPLPLNANAWCRVRARLAEPDMQLLTSSEQRVNFQVSLGYLPETDAQVALAMDLSRNHGVAWDSACERAKRERP